MIRRHRAEAQRELVERLSRNLGAVWNPFLDLSVLVALVLAGLSGDRLLGPAASVDSAAALGTMVGVLGTLFMLLTALATFGPQTVSATYGVGAARVLLHGSRARFLGASYLVAIGRSTKAIQSLTSGRDVRVGIDLRLGVMLMTTSAADICDSFLYWFSPTTWSQRLMHRHLQLPFLGFVGPGLDPGQHVTLDLTEATFRVKFRETILREDIRPLAGVDRVLSANYGGTTILRYLFSQGALLSSLIEVGILGGFDRVYQRALKELSLRTPGTLSGHGVGTGTFHEWISCSLHCSLHVVNSTVVNLNPIFYDFDYFGHNLAASFLIVPGKRMAVLPTLAIICARDARARVLAQAYLIRDCLKRREAVALLNLPFDQ